MQCRPPLFPMRSRRSMAGCPPDAATLCPAEPAEFEQALAHALQFNGCKAFRRADNMLAAIAASHVAQCLERAGFVAMKEPAAAMHSAPAPSLPRFAGHGGVD